MRIVPRAARSAVAESLSEVLDLVAASNDAPAWESIYCVMFIDSHSMILDASRAPAGLFGGVMIVLSGTYAYISQVAAPKARRIRFAILQMLVLAGVTIGTVAGGYLFQDRRYVLVYEVSIAADVVGMCSLALFLEDRNSKKTNMTYA